ncbi:hypothetical protein M0813_20747 [Anaeramoeba flamelloides]|uniref:Uncharacterized protein n=1 Tax=Anaeramoeba flamelloides TaxID=1746091 RepID=A0AAV7ZC33_9EUKA|nr:hypothetical protein M0812_17088 [Anaeramoeba flamelloides]KAJ6245037.1 hypothetical protein M0813_20747 [Anaeramoeba flamelloides]
MSTTQQFDEINKVGSNLNLAKSPTKRVSFRLPEVGNEKENDHEELLVTKFVEADRSTKPVLNTTIISPLDSSMMRYVPRDDNQTVKNVSRNSLTSRYKRSKRKNSRKNRFIAKRTYLSSDPEFDYNTKQQLKLEDISKCQPMFDLLKNPKDFKLFEQFLDIDLEKQMEIFKTWNRK